MSTLNIIPALPGYKVIGIYTSEGRGFWTEDVIAWQNESSERDDEWHTRVTPITIEGSNERLPIVTPSGEVVCVGDRIYSDIISYIDDVTRPKNKDKAAK